MVLLKYLGNFWRTLEMPLSEINLILTWSANYFKIDDPIDNQIPTLVLTDTKLYVPVVTLSTQDNVKLLQQLKSGFKKPINYISIKSNNKGMKPIFRLLNLSKFLRHK